MNNELKILDYIIYRLNGISGNSDLMCLISELEVSRTALKVVGYLERDKMVAALFGGESDAE